MPILEWSEPSEVGANSQFPGIRSDIKGEEWLKQFPQEIQSQVKDYHAGLTMPTGNPRKTNFIKTIASQYGNDIGMPADDTSFQVRKTMRTDLNKTSPASIGGQLSSGYTAWGHLADMAEKAAEMGNWDLGLTPLSHGANMLRGLTTDQAAKINAMNDIRERYITEITKFYAGSPGGQTEKERALANFDAAKTGKELAAAIKTEQEAMRYKLDPLHSKVEDALGPKWIEVSKQIGKLKSMAEGADVKINHSVDRLMGRAPAAAAAQVGAAPQQAGAAPQQVAPAQAAQGPVPGARQAPDGNWYVQQGGKYFKVVP